MRQDALRIRHEVGRPSHLQNDSSSETGNDVLSHHEPRRPHHLQEVHAEPFRDLHRQRYQAHLARPLAVHSEAEGRLEDLEVI